MLLNVNNINLNNDFLKIVKQKFISENYDISRIADDNILIEYYTIQLKKIPVKTRNVKKSAEFKCPDNLLDGLNLLESKILNGDSLIPHQSKNLLQLKKKDEMLYDWNIHHFHLGTKLENNNFIKRTGLLLYAYVDVDNIYFLQILDHGNWAKKDLIKIIHDNWPEVIEHLKINKNGEKFITSYNPTDLERPNLRKANMNSFIEIDEYNVYLSPGGGFTGSGHSIIASLKLLDDRTFLQKLEDDIKNNPKSILKQIFSTMNFVKNNDLHFELIFENGFQLRERNNNVSIKINLLP